MDRWLSSFATTAGFCRSHHCILAHTCHTCHTPPHYRWDYLGRFLRLEHATHCTLPSHLPSPGFVWNCTYLLPVSSLAHIPSLPHHLHTFCTPGPHHLTLLDFTFTRFYPRFSLFYHLQYHFLSLPVSGSPYYHHMPTLGSAHTLFLPFLHRTTGHNLLFTYFYVLPLRSLPTHLHATGSVLFLLPYCGAATHRNAHRFSSHAHAGCVSAWFLTCRIRFFHACHLLLQVPTTTCTTHTATTRTPAVRSLRFLPALTFPARSALWTTLCYRILLPACSDTYCHRHSHTALHTRTACTFYRFLYTLPSFSTTVTVLWLLRYCGLRFTPACGLPCCHTPYHGSHRMPVLYFLYHTPCITPHHRLLLPASARSLCYHAVHTTPWFARAAPPAVCAAHCCARAFSRALFCCLPATCAALLPSAHRFGCTCTRTYRVRAAFCAPPAFARRAHYLPHVRVYILHAILRSLRATAFGLPPTWFTHWFYAPARALRIFAPLPAAVCISGRLAFSLPPALHTHGVLPAPAHCHFAHLLRRLDFVFTAAPLSFLRSALLLPLLHCMRGVPRARTVPRARCALRRRTTAGVGSFIFLL